MTKDYEWIRTHFDELIYKYAGDYVAVVEERIVASGRSGKEVFEAAIKKYPNKKPFVFPVPKKEELNCLL